MQSDTQAGKDGRLTSWSRHCRSSGTALTRPYWGGNSSIRKGINKRACSPQSRSQLDSDSVCLITASSWPFSAAFERVSYRTIEDRQLSFAFQLFPCSR